VLPARLPILGVSLKALALLVLVLPARAGHDRRELRPLFKMRSGRVRSLILHGVEPLRRSALTPSFNSLEATLRKRTRLLQLTEDDMSSRRPRTVIDLRASPDPLKALQPVSPKGALKVLVVVRPHGPSCAGRGG